MDQVEMDEVDPNAVLAAGDWCIAHGHGSQLNADELLDALRTAIAQRDEAKYHIAELERALEDARDALR